LHDLRANKLEKGFTLIELMIVVAIIGILASLALPKFAQLVEKSREATTKGNIAAIQSAISIYYGDNEGIYPTYLEVSSEYIFSRFMDSIPPVKATHSGVGTTGTNESPSGTNVQMTTSEVITATNTGWRYNRVSGRIFINNPATDSKGAPYSTYGY